MVKNHAKNHALFLTHFETFVLFLPNSVKGYLFGVKQRRIQIASKMFKNQAISKFEARTCKNHLFIPLYYIWQTVSEG
jgi:hypothetical protein